MNEEQQAFFKQIQSAHKDATNGVKNLDDALTDLKNTYQGNDYGIQNYLNNTDAANITTDDFTNSLKRNAKASLKAAVAAKALNAAISLGISAAIGIAFKLYDEYGKRIERATQATEDFREEIDTLEEGFATYEKLGKVLQDETSTTEELNAAKEQLLTLQNSLVDTYGKEADGIDLVNGKYEEQIKLLEGIRREEAKAYIKDNKKDLDALTRKMNDEYEFGIVSLFPYGSSAEFANEIKKIYDKYDSLSITENEIGEQSGEFKSDVKDAREQLELIYDDFEDLKKLATTEVEATFIENTLDRLSSKIKKWNEKYSSAADSYETYTNYAIYAADDLTTSDGSTVSFATLYENYLQEVEDFNKAVAEGNYEIIKQAEQELNDARAAADAAIEEARGGTQFDENRVEAMSDAFDILGDSINYAGANLKNAEHILQGLSTGEVLTYNLTTEAPDQQVQDYVNLYVSEIQKAKEANVDFARTVYGNIDTNARQVIEWTEENVEGFRDALESWDIDANDLLGSSSTVLGMRENINDVELAFTPILNTEDGRAIVLNRNTLMRYFDGLFSQLGESWTSEDLLKLDAEGILVDGIKIKNMLAGVAEEAIKVDEAMHFSGADGSIQEAVDHLADTTVITTAELNAIKEMKFSIAELQGYLHSTEGAPYLERLRGLASALNIGFTDLLNLLVGMGYLSDLESPISEDDLDIFVEYQDVIEDVIDGSAPLSTLTDEQRAAWERFNIVADERNAKQEAFLKLVKDTYSLNVQEQINALATANNNLVSATEKTRNALEDIDTIVEVVNGDMYLTDEQMGELVSRHSELANSLTWTEKGWTLEAEAMDLVKDASNSLQTAYITAQQKMTELCASGVGQRLEMYGVELQSMQSILSAFSTGIGKENGGLFFDWKYLMTDDDAKAYYDAVASSGGNINTITGGKYLEESKAVVYAWKLQKQLEKSLSAMEEAKKAVSRTSGSGGSSVEKYAAEIDKLYKALEKQKEIEEDIANIQRARDSLEEDDYDGQIKNIYEEIAALERLNDTLHEQNQIRRSMINQNIADLNAYGFSISYNSAYNELLINNYENLNSLVTSYAKRLGYSTEKTNELIKSVETLINETHELNDANKENSATWQDNTKAVKDYLKEIKKLKTEMVDDYLSKKNDYISHMADFELWDESEVTKQLESMLDDLNEFYDADLLSYEEYVERHNEITKRIYDSRKESLDYIMDMVEDMVRQELDDQVDAYEDQKDALNDIIDAKKKIIELTKTENDYNKSLQDKIKEMARLQERIAQLELDDSREAAAEKAGLIDQLAQLQDEVDSMQYDNSVEKQAEALDEMAENNEELIDKEIEQIEELADNAEYIHNKTIEYIRDNWSSLLSDLIEYNNLHGDGIDENVTQNWENAYSALLEYKEAAWSIAKDMTTGQAVGNTLNPLLPDSGGTAQDVIDAATEAEIANRVSQMKSNSLKWPNAGDNRGYLENENIRLAGEISKLLGEDLKRGNDGVWYLPNGEKLYDKYHVGGTVGSKKKSEVFSLLEQGEDVLTKQHKFTAIPLLQAGIQALNLNENTAKILEALQKNAMPSFAALNSNEPAIHFAPEINIEVNAGSDAKEIAAVTKDAVWSTVVDPFRKMGITSKYRGIKI